MMLKLKQLISNLPLVPRLFIGVSAIIGPLMILVTFFGGEVVYRSLIKVREDQLISVAQKLVDEMPNSYEQILLEHSLSAGTKEEKIAVLNKELQPLVNKFANSHPKIGMGYYDLALQHVVAIGPDFSSDLLTHIPLDHPYLKYVETHDIEVIKHSTSVGWEGRPILGVTVPLYEDGTLIGHTWANIQIEDILLQTKQARRDLFLIIFGLLMIGLLCSSYIFWLGRNALRQFATLVLSTEEESKVSNNGFPELDELVKEVKEKQKYKLLAETDGLTKLNNRQHFENLLDDLFEETVRNSSELSILMLDIDDFKNINDTYGHKVGDEVIKAAANVLLTNTREQDICGRYGGEEFIIALPQTTLDEAFIIAERIRAIVEQTKVKLSNERTIQFTISIGAASYDQELSWEKLQVRADKYLYKAKQNGKNQVQ